jgi:hypothetical protein
MWEVGGVFPTRDIASEKAQMIGLMFDNGPEPSIKQVF